MATGGGASGGAHVQAMWRGRGGVRGGPPRADVSGPIPAWGRVPPVAVTWAGLAAFGLSLLVYRRQQQMNFFLRGCKTHTYAW